MYIGVDIGTGSIKAAVVLKDNFSFHSAAYPSDTERGFEHDTVRVRQALSNLFQEISLVHQASLVHRAGIDSLKGIAMSGHGPSVVLVSDDRRPLSSIITWQNRGARTEERLIGEVFPGFDRGGSSYEGKSLHLFRNKNGLFQKGVKILYPKDYFIALLTGRILTDRSTASTIVFWDDDKRRWDCRKAGIPEEFFPDVIEPWEEAGRTGTSWSRECGLPDNIPVYAGGIDAYCEAVGVGAVEEGDIVDGSGTSTCVSIALPESGIPALSGTKRADRHIVPGLRLRMETMSFTGGSIKWILEVLNQQMETAKSAVRPVPVNLLFLPYLIGERSPVWDENASGAFIGLKPGTRQEELVSAVFQGCSFGIRQNLELLEDVSLSAGIPGKDYVIAAGGGAKNDAWLRMKAQVTGKAYRKPLYPEAAPLGAALIAAVGREGGDPADLAERWIRMERTFEPENGAGSKERYDRLYGLYCSLYNNLRETFQGLADEISPASGEN